MNEPGSHRDNLSTLELRPLSAEQVQCLKSRLRNLGEMTTAEADEFVALTANIHWPKRAIATYPGVDGSPFYCPPGLHLTKLVNGFALVLLREIDGASFLTEQPTIRETVEALQVWLKQRRQPCDRHRVGEDRGAAEVPLPRPRAHPDA